MLQFLVWSSISALNLMVYDLEFLLSSELLSASAFIVPKEDTKMGDSDH